jgi:hypothetical protein
MTRLVQIQNGDRRRVAVVEEPRLCFLDTVSSIHELANLALARSQPLLTLVGELASAETLSYDEVYDGKSSWRLLAPIDHRDDPARCLVSGTGLTHLGSAKNRQAMHGVAAADETDSMRMFRWGLEGGRPAPGAIGIAPEWFYKGNGTILRGPGEALEVPPHGEDGGEESEIAGVYLIDAAGRPRRIGMAVGNEFSDHVFEKKNYLNLAGSKVRTCSLGPELVIDPRFDTILGTVEIEREGAVIWTKALATGEEEMCHSLANIEHHHFKFETHRRPGDLHVHYYGTCALSFGEGIRLRDGDVMIMQFAGFGRPLRNPLRVAAPVSAPLTVASLA